MSHLVDSPILKVREFMDLANMEEFQAIEHHKVTAENSITTQKEKILKLMGQLLRSILDLAEPKSTLRQAPNLIVSDVSSLESSTH